MTRLERDRAVLIVIDVQEKLARVIHQYDTVERNIDRLVRGCQILGVPAVLTEQYPKGLGATTAVVKRAFDESYGIEPIEKMCFSNYGCAQFVGALEALGRRQVLVAGIEAHVCVYQTVRDLLAAEYQVTVIADAVSSRTPENRDMALRRMSDDGAQIASTEMALFEMTVEAGTEEFRKISALVK
jgi:nicotinamidase-related amidase